MWYRVQVAVDVWCRLDLPLSPPAVATIERGATPQEQLSCHASVINCDAVQSVLSNTLDFSSHIIRGEGVLVVNPPS